MTLPCNILKRILFASLIHLLLFANTSSVLAQEQEENPELPEPIDITASTITYNQDSGILMANGNVELSYKGHKFSCEELNFDTLHNNLTTRGNVDWQYGTWTIKGDEVHYDFVADSGSFVNARSEFAPWYCYGEQIVRSGTNEMVLINGWVSTCDLSSPHWRVSSDRITVTLDDAVRAWNTTTYIGKIPVFWVPYFSRSLKERKSRWSAQLGSNSELGYFVKARYGWPWGQYNDGAAHIDYMTKKGVGIGLDATYKKEDTLNGLGQVYWVQEKDTKKDQFRINLQHYQKWTDKLSLNGEAQYLTSQTLNYIFLRDSAAIPKPSYLQSRVGLTWSDKYQTARLFVSSRQDWDEGLSKYCTTAETMPGMLWVLQPRPLGALKWLYSARVEGKRDYERETGLRYWGGSANNAIETTYRLPANLAVSPKFTIDKQWRESSGYPTKYDGTISGSWRLTRRTELRPVYQYAWTAQNDVLSNAARVALIMRPLSSLLLETKSGYNLLNKSWDNVETRLSGRGTGNDWNMRHILNTRTMTTELGELGVNVLTQSDVKVQSSIRYLIELPGRMDANVSMQCPVGSKLLLNANHRFQVPDGRWQEKETSIFLTRDLHCWWGKFGLERKWRSEDIGCDNTIWLLFSIKAFPEQEIGTSYETEFNQIRFRTSN